jgi:hypothetical protein
MRGMYGSTCLACMALRASHVWLYVPRMYGCTCLACSHFLCLRVLGVINIIFIRAVRACVSYVIFTCIACTCGFTLQFDHFVSAGTKPLSRHYAWFDHAGYVPVYMFVVLHLLCVCVVSAIVADAPWYLEPLRLRHTGTCCMHGMYVCVYICMLCVDDTCLHRYTHAWTYTCRAECHPRLAQQGPYNISQNRYSHTHKLPCGSICVFRAQCGLNLTISTAWLEFDHQHSVA